LPALIILEVEAGFGSIGEGRSGFPAWQESVKTSGTESLTYEDTKVNFALTIGMLKLRRRLRSTRPARRPMLDWATLHIPVMPCLMGWRERIRR
jgi:hypothetical protein